MPISRKDLRNASSLFCKLADATAPSDNEAESFADALDQVLNEISDNKDALLHMVRILHSGLAYGNWPTTRGRS